MWPVFFRLLAVLAGFILLIAGIGSLLPREFSLEQSIEIAAPIEVVFQRVNDLNRWLEWSPWRSENLGADKIQIGEPSAGSGAKFRWEDPRGPGKLWLSDSEPNRRVEYSLSVAQFQEVRGEFLLDGGDGTTIVTWKCRGKLPGGPFYGYLRGLFGAEMRRQFQASLQRLKDECETNRTSG